ncbi:MAG TPA: VOC family protein [Phnomibacter sp.]|nr:VOC family protein [Phnomibacter sp.]
MTYIVIPNYYRLMKVLFILLCLGWLVASSPAAAQQTRINHIAFTVKDLGKSSRFYRQVLQLDTIPNPFNDAIHLWLNIGGGASLHLIQGTRIPVSIKDTHICFSVSSVEALAEKLSRAGIAFESWTGEKGQWTNRADGVKQIYLQDPDGYWLEVNDQQ